MFTPNRLVCADRKSTKISEKVWVLVILRSMSCPRYCHVGKTQGTRRRSRAFVWISLDSRRSSMLESSEPASSSPHFNNSGDTDDDSRFSCQVFAFLPRAGQLFARCVGQHLLSLFVHFSSLLGFLAHGVCFSSSPLGESSSFVVVEVCILYSEYRLKNRHSSHSRCCLCLVVPRCGERRRA